MGPHNIVWAIGTEREEVEWEFKCLPAAAVSIAGVFVLTSVWCGPTPDKGGFREFEHRNAAQELLEALTAAAVEQLPDGTTLHLVFDDEWSFKPPRPQVDSGFSLDLRVPEGKLDLSEWHRLVRWPNVSFC